MFKSRNSIGRSLGIRRPSLLAVLATITTLAILLASEPGAEAASVTAKLSAPYHGAVTWSTNSILTAGCAYAKNLKKASWNATTGKGTFSELANLTACKSQLGGATSQAVASGGYKIAIPVPIGSSSPHKVTVRWHLSLNFTGSTSPGTCLPSNASSYSCRLSRAVQLYTTALLQDTTNGSQFAPSEVCSSVCHKNYGDWTFFEQSQNTTSCSSTGCTFSNMTLVSGRLGSTLTWFFNKTGALASNDSYVLSLYLVAFASVNLVATNTGITGAVAYERFNGGTSGNFEKLESITVK